MTDERRLQWAQSEDKIGKQMIAAVSAANKLRKENAAMRRGWANILHEDRPNGVSACVREEESRGRCEGVRGPSDRRVEEGSHLVSPRLPPPHHHLTSPSPHLLPLCFNPNALPLSPWMIPGGGL